MMRISVLMAAVLQIFFACSVHAYEVIGINDGDSMTVLVDLKPIKIRLANIDAPEKKQPFGQMSKQSLSDLCWGSNATYVPGSTDVYGRTVAVVKCNGVEANRFQVQKGMAWVYSRYNKDLELPDIEKQAKLKAVGLWSAKGAEPPWEFRKRR